MSRPRKPSSAPASTGKLADGIGVVGELIAGAFIVVVMCIPVITALPAISVVQWRTVAIGQGKGTSGLWRRYVAAIRWGWVPTLMIEALLVLAWFDYSVSITTMPEAKPSAIAAIIVNIAAAVVALRGAAQWAPGVRWRDAMMEGALRCRRDVLGTVLVLAAVVVCGVLVWYLWWTVVLVPGLLVWVLTIVETRRGAQ